MYANAMQSIYGVHGVVSEVTEADGWYWRRLFLDLYIIIHRGAMHHAYALFFFYQTTII